MPHADCCYRWIEIGEGGKYCLEDNESEIDETVEYFNAVHVFGYLYANQGKLDAAEKMYVRALEAKEKALGVDHTSTLDTVNNLGNLYKCQASECNNGWPFATLTL